MSAHAPAAPPGAGPDSPLPEVPDLSVSEAARYLRCSPTFVYKLCEQGRIEHERLGNRIRFAKCWLDAYRAANHRKPAAVAQ
jgi:excisionase family DNA binding protein